MGGDKNVFFHIKINWKENINSKVKRGLLEERQLEKEKIDEVTFGRIQIMGWKENRRDRKKQTNDETKRQTKPPLLFRCLFFFFFFQGFWFVQNPSRLLGVLRFSLTAHPLSQR